MSKSSDSSANESAGMELTSCGQSFIEAIYLNPQCLLKHHENSTGKKVRRSGAACRVLLSVSSVWDSCI